MEIELERKLNTNLQIYFLIFEKAWHIMNYEMFKVFGADWVCSAMSLNYKFLNIIYLGKILSLLFYCHNTIAES